MKIEIQSPGNDEHDALGERLMAFNMKQRPQARWRKEVFTVLLKDDSGKLRGGARGAIRMGAIDLQTLWLDEDLRRGGLGAKIVRAVEDEGKQRGAHAVLLYTYDFQARYCIGSFEFPDGVTRFYMCRTL